MKEKLKIGIILNDFHLPAWQFMILENLVHSDFAEIALLIKYNSINSSGIKKKCTAGYSIMKFHERIDGLIFRGNSDYFLIKDSTGLLKDLTEIVINPYEKNSVLTLEQEEIAEFKKYNLDIVVNLGFCVLKGDILKTIRYGIWSFDMGDNRIINTVTTGYWEVVENRTVTTSSLEILREGSERSSTIFSSSESTYSYSISVNRNIVYWRASLFIPRIVNGIYKYGDSYLDNLINKNRDKDKGDFTKSLSAPSSIPALKNLLLSFGRITRQIAKKIFYTDSFNWVLLYEISDVEDVFKKSFGLFKKIQSSKDKFWADPFVLRRNDKYYIFAEEFIFKEDKGHISVIELDDAGNVLRSERIIERPYHLSYPFIFEMDGSYYIIPETSHDKTIQLFKCSEFPFKWEFTKNIMENIAAVDTTLFFHENKWWLFTSVDETDNNKGCSTELFLFFTEDLFSDNWESHPCNPIVSDIRTARPAGRIFIEDNKICRPSQDCSVRYGRGFNLNQITVLTETEYEEKLLLKIEPEWDNKLKGTHTFNFDKNITIIDAYSYRRRI